MLNERELHYVEIDDTPEKAPQKESMAGGILSLVFGILSVFLCGIIGIIFGALAKKIASATILNYKETLTAKLAGAGRIVGTFGIILSIVNIVLFLLCVCAVVAVILILK